MTALQYEKFGGRIATDDESNDRLRDFMFQGTQATAEAKGWELLQGCFERHPDGFWAGEEVVVYLWPCCRDGGASWR